MPSVREIAARFSECNLNQYDYQKVHGVVQQLPVLTVPSIQLNPENTTAASVLRAKPVEVEKSDDRSNQSLIKPSIIAPAITRVYPIQIVLQSKADDEKADVYRIDSEAERDQQREAVLELFLKTIREDELECMHKICTGAVVRRVAEFYADKAKKGLQQKQADERAAMVAAETTRNEERTATEKAAERTREIQRQQQIEVARIKAEEDRKREIQRQQQIQAARIKAQDREMQREDDRKHMRRSEKQREKQHDEVRRTRVLRQIEAPRVTLHTGYCWHMFDDCHYLTRDTDHLNKTGGC